MNKIFGFIQKTLSAALALMLLATSVEATPQLATPGENPIASSYYQVEGDMIKGIAPGTTGEKLRKVCAPGSLSAPAGKLATGDRLTYKPAEGSPKSLTVIVTADLNGDGNVTITDLLQFKAHLLGGKLDTNAAAASDVNYDGKVTLTDFLRIKSNLLGMEKIGPGKSAEAKDPLILLMPGSSQHWTVPGAASYVSSDEALATVDQTGKVTALSSEGSGFIYALDSRGQELDRAIVTVLDEKLTVSLGQSSMRLAMGNTANLKANLNHPVQAKVSWVSADSQVATVADDGTVHALRAGTTVITAQLPNGSKAQLALTVAPPITAVKTERKLYKVKPDHTKKINLLTTPAGETEIFTWQSSDPAVARVSDDGTITGVTYGTATITVTGKYSGLTASCDVKICDVKQVALTFDDGPSGYSAKLLDYLKKNDIRVTFFLVGNRMDMFSDTVKREVAEGHEIGYHSYAHKMQAGLSDAQIKSDFEKSNKILKEMTGAEFTLWRTPGGNYNDRILNAIALPHIMWSVDTQDWKNRNSYSVYVSVKNAKDGDIVLMHDLYSSTVTGTIQALEEMQKGDYEFVTVTELLSRNGTAPQPGVSYARG